MSDNYGAAKELAGESGFTHTAELNVSAIETREDVRAVCEQNICGVYGANWACPPGCGSLAECTEKIKRYRRGLILQTVGEIEDSLDLEGMEEAAEAHGNHLREFGDKIRERYPAALLVTAHGCRRCKTCACPGEPCRFPDRATVSMEGLGIVLADVCKNNGVPFHYGANTQTFTAFVLFD
jgi:predicted metal-binding protein